MEGLEKRIARVQRAAKTLQKAYKVMNEASLGFVEALVPFAEGRDDSIIVSYSRALSSVYESELNLGERLPSVLVDALQQFVDNEVKPGAELYSKMVKARDQYDSANVKLAKEKTKKGLSTSGEK